MSFNFSRIKHSDLPMLHEWLNQPHISQVWDGPIPIDQMLKKFELHIHSNHIFGYLIRNSDVAIGYAQAYEACRVGGGWWPEIESGTWGIDQFLANRDHLGIGLGTEMVRAFCKLIFEKHRASQIIADPSPNNSRAIRCYEKVGFLAAGEIDTPDGRALLMKLMRQ
jgi:RimJ/RimL family protein N-acetyltransferase